MNFSYSGIKTAALYKTKELREIYEKDSVWVYDFCRGFLDTIVESLLIKLERALDMYPEVRSVFVGGGVFNSEEIVRRIGGFVRENGLNYVYSEKKYRGDNGGMIGLVGYLKILRKEYLTKKRDIEGVDREPRLGF